MLRRGRGKKGKNSNKIASYLFIIGNNVAGLKGKVKSLEKNIEKFSPGVLLLQETKMKKMSQMSIPEFLMFTNITSIWKQKGEKSDLANDRGIFGVSKNRAIIEKLVYEDSHEVIENSMSDSNVGVRKKRNIRDNLFVLYASINDAIRNKKNIDIQYYDIYK